MEFLQSLVDPISGILLSASDHLCDVLLELCLVGGLIAKERVDGLNYHILQYRLIDGSCVAFLPGRLQSTDAAPDDGFAAVVVPVDAPIKLAAVSAENHLCKTVIAGETAFLTGRADMDYPAMDKLCLHMHEEVFRNDRFVVAFNVVLGNGAFVLDPLFCQEVRGIGLLKQRVTHVHLVAENFKFQYLRCA